MTDKARHRLAARAHRRALKERDRLRRELLRQVQSIYPVRVGQCYVNALGGRFIVQSVDWIVGADWDIWQQGPLVVLRFDADDFTLRVVKYWDELAAGYRRARKGK